MIVQDLLEPVSDGSDGGENMYSGMLAAASDPRKDKGGLMSENVYIHSLKNRCSYQFFCEHAKGLCVDWISRKKTNRFTASPAPHGCGYMNQRQNRLGLACYRNGS